MIMTKIRKETMTIRIDLEKIKTLKEVSDKQLKEMFSRLRA